MNIAIKNRLAMNGGHPVKDVVENPWPQWPVWDSNEEMALLRVLRSGVWSYNGPFEQEFNRAFAAYCGTRYAISCANGTITLQLALEALGIGHGDEVIVPGLTWQATAAAVIDVNAIPVIVDVLPGNWCIDPAQIEAHISPATKAIIPVHLYGSFCDMDQIREIANRNKLYIIEDCAHKHGGEWKGQKAGSMGDIGSFSFQLSKILTAGEGGALTTNNPELADKLDALRNCGRRPERGANPEADKGAGQYGDEGNFIQSGNYRITEFQAAILVEGLKRLPAQNKIRDQNGIYLNSLLQDLPGVYPMERDSRETAETYFNFAFRYKTGEFGDLPVNVFRSALQAELGLQVDSCYSPLNRCSLYAPHTKPSRHKIDLEYWNAIDPKKYSLPIAEKAYEEEAICFHHKLLMGSKKDMDLVHRAIEKIFTQKESLLDGI